MLIITDLKFKFKSFSLYIIILKITKKRKKVSFNQDKEPLMIYFFRITFLASLWVEWSSVELLVVLLSDFEM